MDPICIVKIIEYTGWLDYGKDRLDWTNRADRRLIATNHLIGGLTTRFHNTIWKHCCRDGDLRSGMGAAEGMGQLCQDGDASGGAATAGQRCDSAWTGREMKRLCGTSRASERRGQKKCQVMCVTAFKSSRTIFFQNIFVVFNYTAQLRQSQMHAHLPLWTHAHKPTSMSISE